MSRVIVLCFAKSSQAKYVAISRAGQDSTFLDSMDSNLLEGGFDGFESRFESALRRVLSDIRYSARQLCAKQGSRVRALSTPNNIIES